MRAGDWRPHQRGFTFVWVLAAVALTSLGLAVVGPTWGTANQRMREQELLKVGSAYAAAIDDYYRFSPGTLKSYPTSLDQLLADERFVGIRRHIRRLYTDPMAPGQTFALIRGEDGGIRGVYSRSDMRPFAQDGLNLDGVFLPSNALRYSDWKFMPKEKS